MSDTSYIYVNWYVGQFNGVCVTLMVCQAHYIYIYVNWYVGQFNCVCVTLMVCQAHYIYICQLVCGSNQWCMCNVCGMSGTLYIYIYICQLACGSIQWCMCHVNGMSGTLYIYVNWYVGQFNGVCVTFGAFIKVWILRHYIYHF